MGCDCNNNSFICNVYLHTNTIIYNKIYNIDMLYGRLATEIVQSAEYDLRCAYDIYYSIKIYIVVITYINYTYKCSV